VGASLSLVLGENTCGWRLLEWAKGALPEDPIKEVWEPQGGFRACRFPRRALPLLRSRADAPLIIPSLLGHNGLPALSPVCLGGCGQLSDLPLRRVEAPRCANGGRSTLHMRFGREHTKTDGLLALLVPERLYYRLTLIERRQPEYERRIAAYEPFGHDQVDACVGDLRSR